MNPRVVVLVDDKKRDLSLASLLAHHLDQLGVDCILEPLEAFRAVLGAHRPGMIVFNHLNASHLVEYSQRLADIGVLTGVLSNEGLVYNPEQMKFVSNLHHRDAHIDYFFCWNQPHHDALVAAGFGERTRIEVVGVPRFDFYFEPWSRIFRLERPRSRARPQVLLCTNFHIAKLWERPKAEADKFFRAWANRIPEYKEYWKSVEQSFLGRQRFLDHAAALLAAQKFDLVLRPHPREDPAFYANWIATLPAAERQRVRLEADANIAALILDCDVEISCETCTTAVEAWLARKPTLELIFFKNPMLYFAEPAAANTPCATPADLPAAVDRVLRGEVDAAVLAAREALLRKWCNSPDGTTGERLTRLIAQALGDAHPADWSKLTAADRRRSTKLHLFRKLGLAYNFDPLMPLKLRVNRERYAGKNYAYQKAIRPREVAEAREQLVRALGAR